MLFVAEAAEEGVHGLPLVAQAQKLVREASAGRFVATSGIKFVVPPRLWPKDLRKRGGHGLVSQLCRCLRTARKVSGLQDAGKMGWHWTLPEPSRQSLWQTPSPPLAKRTLTPRAPSSANRRRTNNP